MAFHDHAYMGRKSKRHLADRGEPFWRRATTGLHQRMDTNDTRHERAAVQGPTRRGQQFETGHREKSTRGFNQKEQINLNC